MGAEDAETDGEMDLAIPLNFLSIGDKGAPLSSNNEGEDGEGETGGLTNSADEKFSTCHETRLDSMASLFSVESLIAVFN